MQTSREVHSRRGNSHYKVAEARERCLFCSAMRKGLQHKEVRAGSGGVLEARGDCRAGMVVLRLP